MRYIDLQTWPRYEHFKVYSAFDQPHFSLCAHVDLTAFHPHVRQRDLSLTAAVVYVLTRAANAIPEFRYRMRAGAVVEHEIVHPSITVLTPGDLFSFCTLEYREAFSAFAAGAAERIAHARAHPTLADEPGQDNLLFMTAIPWVSFTSFTHPMHRPAADSVPRFAWGKIFEEGGSLKMPLSAQGHHALMDGVHLGQFYIKVQEYLRQPEVWLGEV